jgi:hypothetical protein
MKPSARPAAVLLVDDLSITRHGGGRRNELHTVVDSARVVTIAHLVSPVAARRGWWEWRRAKAATSGV